VNFHRALFEVLGVFGLVHPFHDFIHQHLDILGDALFGLLHQIVEKCHAHEPLLALVRTDCLSVAVASEHAIQSEQLVVQEGLHIQYRETQALQRLNATLGLRKSVASALGVFVSGAIAHVSIDRVELCVVETGLGILQRHINDVGKFGSHADLEQGSIGLRRFGHSLLEERLEFGFLGDILLVRNLAILLELENDLPVIVRTRGHHHGGTDLGIHDFLGLLKDLLNDLTSIKEEPIRHQGNVIRKLGGLDNLVEPLEHIHDDCLFQFGRVPHGDDGFLRIFIQGLEEPITVKPNRRAIQFRD